MAPRLLVALAALALSLAPAAACAQVVVPGAFQLTRYWIAHEAPQPDDRAARVLDPQGRTLTWCTSRFADALAMEGTGRSWDGRLFNWSSRRAGHSCFVEVDPTLYPFGIGVAGYALVPYRSLAVDPRFVPLGSPVELPELIGMPLPDGSTHDGCFVAVDRGGAINGHHLDLFLPSPAAHRELQRMGWLPDSVHVVLDSPRCEHARRFAIHPLPHEPRVVPRS